MDGVFDDLNLLAKCNYTISLRATGHFIVEDI